MTTTETSATKRGSSKPTMDTMHAVLDVPYTLTAGKAAGTYLAELANSRIVGSVFEGRDDVVVPAQDFLADSGAEATGFVVVPSSGHVVAVTSGAFGRLALIRLVGASTDILHQLVGDAAVEPGQAVRAVFAEERTGRAEDLLGFEPVDEVDADAAVTPLQDPAEPAAELGYRLALHYDHAYGQFYGRLFDEIAAGKRIVGVRCPKCRNVMVPPRELCDQCYVRTAEWVDIPDTGVIQGCSVVHIEFLGQRRKPPYVYVEIVLDDASTRLIHTLGNVDMATANELIKPGVRVRAHWRDGVATGSLDDIDFFEPIDDDLRVEDPS